MNEIYFLSCFYFCFSPSNIFKIVLELVQSSDFLEGLECEISK